LDLGACQATTTTAQGGPSDCPIPGGTVTCGSKMTPVVYNNSLSQQQGENECGHCGVGYPAAATQAYCGYVGTQYAIDVVQNTSDPTGNDFASVYLPQIAGHTVAWTRIYEENQGNEAIQGYSGTDLTTNQKYYLQFHHTQPGSGAPENTTLHSGDVGAKICGDGCNEYHVHIQIASGADLSAANNGGWLDATQLFCRNETANSHYVDDNQ